MFRLDHVWVTAEDRDEALARMSKATGLPILDGWAPRGKVRSRGVRFANGPFLDVHLPESGGAPAMALFAGRVAEAGRLAAQHGWRRTLSRSADVSLRPPWSILMFGRGQGALSAMAVIDYEADPATWPVAEYAAQLFAQTAPPGLGPMLNRLWIGGVENFDGIAAAFGYLGSEHLGLDGVHIAPVEGEGVIAIEVSGVVAPPMRIGLLEVRFSVV